MSKPHIIMVLCLATARLCGGEAEPSPFIREVRAVQAEEAALFSALEKKVEDDHLLEANAELIARADALHRPTFDFVAANMLYDLDREAALRLQRRVIAALPKEPAVNLEWALVCQRVDDVEAAIPAYQLYLAAFPEDCAHWALLAGCLVQAKRYREAVEAWDKAKHGGHHTGIDFAIYSVAGPICAQRRRADLLARLAAGERGAAGALIALDADWNTDWWNGHVAHALLERDLARLRTLLGEGAPEYREVAALAETAGHEELDAKALVAALTPARLLLDGGSLPTSSVVASHLISKVLETKADAAAGLLARHGAELRRRATATPGDSEALNILCVLVTRTGDQAQLRTLDRQGWDAFHEVGYATSLLAGFASEHALNAATPELARALTEFPRNALLQHTRLEMLAPADTTADDIALAIVAEYHGLSIGMAMRDSYTLKGYFARLRDRVKP